jgi:cobalamin synthase
MAEIGKTPGIVAILAVLLVGGIVLGGTGILAGLSTVCVTAAIGAYLKQRLGGYTGDTLGMVCELTEVLAGIVIVSVQ